MRRLLIWAPVLLLAGCVSEAQYQELAYRLKAEAAKNRKAVEQVTMLDSENIRLRAKLQEMGLKLDEMGLELRAMREKMKWGAGIEVGPEGQAIMRGDLLFKPGSHEISTAGKAALDQVARAIVEQNPTVVRIEGHTDNDPIQKSRGRYNSNFHLSSMRALSVLDYLVKFGHVPAEKLYVAGYGEHSPADPANKPRNRRVELRAFK